MVMPPMPVTYEGERSGSEGREGLVVTGRKAAIFLPPSGVCLYGSVQAGRALHLLQMANCFIHVIGMCLGCHCWQLAVVWEWESRTRN